MNGRRRPLLISAIILTLVIVALTFASWNRDGLGIDRSVDFEFGVVDGIEDLALSIHTPNDSGHPWTVVRHATSCGCLHVDSYSVDTQPNSEFIAKIRYGATTVIGAQSQRVVFYFENGGSLTVNVKGNVSPVIRINPSSLTIDAGDVADFGVFSVVSRNGTVDCDIQVQDNPSVDVTSQAPEFVRGVLLRKYIVKRHPGFTGRNATLEILCSDGVNRVLPVWFLNTEVWTVSPKAIVLSRRRNYDQVSKARIFVRCNRKHAVALTAASHPSNLGVSVDPEPSGFSITAPRGLGKPFEIRLIDSDGGLVAEVPITFEDYDE